LPCRVRARFLGDSKCTHLRGMSSSTRWPTLFWKKLGGKFQAKHWRSSAIREEGLIILWITVREKSSITNCCSCCCWNVMPIKSGGPRDYIMATYYLRTTDEDECIGSVNALKMPARIITMENDLPVLMRVLHWLRSMPSSCPRGGQLKRKDDKVPLRTSRFYTKPQLKTRFQKTNPKRFF